MSDQAELLRQRMNPKNSETRKTRIVTVTSGKGGVGKSNFSLNFALSLIKQHKNVMIMDMDLGLANIDVLMGVFPRKNLMDLVESEDTIWDILEVGPLGLQFVAGGSGFQHVFNQSQEKLDIFFGKLEQLQGVVDYIILDTGAGLSAESLQLMISSDECIIVTTPEPTSLTDAYAVLKMIHNKDSEVKTQLVINRCLNEGEGRRTAAKLQGVTKRFLQKEILFLGELPDDTMVTKAVRMQVPFLLEFPKSKASEALTRMTLHYLDLPSQQSGKFKNFFKEIFSQRGGT